MCQKRVPAVDIFERVYFGVLSVDPDGCSFMQRALNLVNATPLLRLPTARICGPQTLLQVDDKSCVLQGESEKGKTVPAIRNVQERQRQPCSISRNRAYSGKQLPSFERKKEEIRYTNKRKRMATSCANSFVPSQYYGLCW